MRTRAFLTLSLLLVAATAWSEKPARSAGARTLPPMMQTQGEPGQRLKDQAAVYRFRLAPADFSCDLEATNGASGDGTFRFVARDQSGEAMHEVSATLAPGETLRIPALEARWTSQGLGYVKASRRVRLSLRCPDSPQPMAVRLHPAASQYDVFSVERRPEVAAANEVEPLSRTVAPHAAASPGAGTAGRLFVSHRAK